MKNFKGFTLIELLVVISIIGVISSIVFVSFSGSRDKARLAKAQNFDAQISHALGAYAVGIWRFEDISGGKVSDESGFNNNGTISGNPVLVDSEIYAGTKALKFDGSGDYVNCGNNTSLKPEQITIELWAKFNVIGTAELVGRGNLNDHNGYFLVSGSNKIYFYASYDGTDTDYDIAVIHNFNTTGEWTHIVAVASDSDVMLYLNGALAANRGSRRGLLNYSRSDSSVVIGALCYAPAAWPYFNGSIDNVSIYEEALSSSQIQQHYVAGPHTNYSLVWGRAPLPTASQ